MHQLRQLLLSLTLFLALAAPVWAQVGLIRGTVTDEEGNPIPEVRITITTEQLSSFRKTISTNKRGQFRIRFPGNQIQYLFDFLFEKPGFQSFSQPLSASSVDAPNETYVMEALQSQVVESHGDLSAVVTGSTNAAVEAFNEGLTAQRSGSLDLARARYEAALEADGSLAPAHLALAQVLLDQDEYDSAIASAERSLELSGNRAEGLRVQYAALRALGREKEADEIAIELEAAEDAASTAVRLYNEGGEAFESGDNASALSNFREAAELDPTLVDAHHAIATLELAAGNYEASAEAAEKALALGSEDVRTLRVLYDAYDELGRIDELTEIAPRLAAVDPQYGGAKLLEQAATMWNSGQTERAVTLSRLALAIDPSLAKAHYFLGLDYLSRGENAEARASLERFIELAPDDPDAAAASEMLKYVE
jgi:tetratricopeptide (TPR) repeat protein